METAQAARYRATAGDEQEFGPTPQAALNALLARVAGDVSTPIVIWPCNVGDAYFSSAQQRRLQELKKRRAALSPEERRELESLIESSFDATISRTQSMPVVKR
jgi:hypothetical protein